MDPRELPPMRSGIGPGSGHDPSADDAIRQTRNRLIAMVTVMTRKAAELASLWSLHGNRDKTVAEDVNVALKHQAKHFLSTIDDPAVIQEIEDMERDIFEADSEDTEDSDTDDTASSGTMVIDEVPPYECIERDGQCVCHMCTEMRAADASWATWEPEDEAERYLKTSVDLAIEAARQKFSSEDDTVQ